MVQAVINISEESNRALNVVKAIYGLKDKSQAIDRVVREYSAKILEPQVRPEYAERLKAIEREPRVKLDVDDFFGLDE